MYRMVIVDDEPIVADCLFELFQRQNICTELEVYKVYSAREALSLFDSNKMDIILTDIRMPGMSGLQLLDRIKESWPQCRVIFLTGFKEFDYVYNAIQYPGVQYLLKTESNEKILDAVRKAINEIEESIQSYELLNHARVQMDRALPLLQREYLQSLLDGLEDKDESAQERLDELKIPIDADKMLIAAVGHFDRWPAGLKTSDRERFNYSIKSFAEQCIDTKQNRLFFLLDQAKFVWLIQPSVQQDFLPFEYETAEWARTIARLRGALENVQNASKKTLGTTISFAVSDQPFLLADCAQKYDYLKQLLGFGLGLTREVIVSEGGPVNLIKDRIPTSLGTVLDARKYLKRLKILEACLESSQNEEFFKIFLYITDELRNVSGMAYSPALENYYSISTLLLGYINRHGLTEKISLRIDLNKLMRADDHPSWNSGVEYLHELACLIFELQKNEEGKSFTGIIDYLQEYISTHLHEDLSLIRLADIVHLNSSYLSRLFKQVTDKNISDYILNQRLEKAKMLLKQKNKKINEISAEVGYESPHSFARLFRNATGVSPQEYRDLAHK